MTSKFFKNGLVLLLMIASFANIKAQEKSNGLGVPQILLLNDLISNDTYFFNGSIELKNNEILNGRISVNYKNDGKYSAILKSDDESIVIPNDEIKVISIARENNEPTNFVAINDDGKMYREVFAKDNDKKIYDTSKKPFDGMLIGEVIIKDKSELINTYDFWSSGAKKDLINYFSKRDRIKYKRKDFETIDELFAIL